MYRYIAGVSPGAGLHINPTEHDARMQRSVTVRFLDITCETRRARHYPRAPEPTPPHVPRFNHGRRGQPGFFQVRRAASLRAWFGWETEYAPGGIQAP